MPLLELTRVTTRIIGAKAVKRALSKNTVSAVIIAKDAEPGIVGELIAECERLGIPVQYIETRRDLGLACGLKVGAAAIALIVEDSEGKQ